MKSGMNEGLTIAELKVHEHIDWSYFCLSQIREQVEKEKPRDPITMMVDKATGYDKELDKKRAELMETSAYHLRRIILYKKKLNKLFGRTHDFSNDQKALGEISKLLKAHA